MRLYILEINFAHKISFLHATSTSEAIKRFQRIYIQYAEQVPSHIREVHANEKVIMDTRTGEVHCIGDNIILKKCLDNLMHIHTPINWVPSLEVHQNIIQEPVSFIIDIACLNGDDPQYNEVGINTWENILQVSLHESEGFWNALKGFLQIEMVSIFELEQLLKVNGKKRS